MTTQVVDSSAIAGNRRTRRAQRAGLDVRKLWRRLRRYAQGAREGGRVVHGPSVAAEDGRQLHRDLETLKQERASTTTRLKGLRSRPGRRLTSLSQCPAQLDALRRWEGAELPRGLHRRLLWGWAPHQGLSEPMVAVAAERRAVRQSAEDASREQGRQLRPRPGLGIKGAWGWGMALFGGRALQQRRAVGGVAG
jgi:transposase